MGYIVGYKDPRVKGPYQGPMISTFDRFLSLEFRVDPTLEALNSEPSTLNSKPAGKVASLRFGMSIGA